MARQPIKPELTTRELYDLFCLERKFAHCFDTKITGFSIILWDNGGLSIDVDEELGEQLFMFEYQKQSIIDQIISLLRFLGDRYTLPPFESNFIDRSRL